ncbi:MAG TPA: M28 family metallopeptidase [Oscillospiraceae bacterium]|nr:M28 family metallopeptidase [Oscillospiraceae bacterium]HPS34506.1 M28 family metallopeptidase [Oscillospiraceae bacterium]
MAINRQSFVAPRSFDCAYLRVRSAQDDIFYIILYYGGKPIMNINGNRMYKNLKELDFIRLSATEGEIRGREILAAKVRELGLEPTIELFKAPKYTIKNCKFEVTSPKHTVYEATGYGFSGNGAKDGLEAAFKYAENGEDIDLFDAKGKIVLLSNGAGYETYERLVKAGVVGFIGASGSYRDRRTDSDLDLRMLRENHIKHGQIPGVCIRTEDAIKLINSKPEKVKITLEQDEGEGDSANVITEIKGTKYPDEVITYTAHYDSVVFSHGMYDNAAGSVILLEMAAYFIKNPPLRTLRFIWCGSEERGLLGSKDYIKTHESELDKIRLSINVDLAGPVIGRDTAIVLAEEKVCHVIEFMYKELGRPMSTRWDTYSSDCIPFADKGIPAVNFVRFGAGTASDCHNRHDTLKPLSADSLRNTAEFVAMFSERVANAAMFPIARTIPDEMVKKIDKYLLKDKK